MQMPDEQSEFPIRDVWNLPTQHLGRHVVVYAEVDSTNSRAAAAARNGGEGGAFLADRQTAGRGQHGRSWFAPPRRGVLLSLLVHPPPRLARPVILTAWAAVVVAELVEAMTGRAAQIKWPNDVLVGQKKVCGILIEQFVRAERIVAVAGIGLNVAQGLDDFAELPDATSLRVLGGDVDIDVVARELIVRLDAEYDALLREGSSLETRWATTLGVIGAEVIAECVGGEVYGRVVEIGFDGVRLARGSHATVLAPETIRHLRRV